jgi:hypothetical protein
MPISVTVVAYFPGEGLNNLQNHEETWNLLTPQRHTNFDMIINKEQTLKCVKWKW